MSTHAEALAIDLEHLRADGLSRADHEDAASTIVDHDNPLHAEIVAALAAAYQRGWQAGLEEAAAIVKGTSHPDSGPYRQWLFWPSEDRSTESNIARFADDASNAIRVASILLGAKLG